jgi:hypothetical protein
VEQQASEMPPVQHGLELQPSVIAAQPPSHTPAALQVMPGQHSIALHWLPYGAQFTGGISYLLHIFLMTSHDIPRQH